MRIDFTPDPALYPFTPRWFDSTAGSMHYIDEGSGQAILLCHGNPTWSFLYRDMSVPTTYVPSPSMVVLGAGGGGVSDRLLSLCRQLVPGA